MMRYLAVLLFTVFFASSVFASHCPTLIHKIDEQLKMVQLDSATETRIKELRDRGQALHNQGKHAESVKVLNKAIDELDAAM
ncbi:hypothetical protein [Marinobacter litoralis]|uniref:hypothetical protein n=1 Tax=Marinobacter litoralis TaxID=187981 RepID=UPI0018EAFAE9|nr:hypothetical protein [Marinobacter litoralis]MBJ6137047.1 hypothetical protein [Marinobacter litoralis]